MEVFREKVAVVTGAGSGIGKALSEKLAAMGSNVFASDIDTRKVEQTVSGITANGGKAWSETLDVTDYESFERYIEGIYSTHGRVDYLFNNAGITVYSEIHDSKVEHWHRVIDVNLNGVFYGSLIAYRRMIRQGWGYIINMSSLEGLIPIPTNTAYVASKYAVLGFSQALWVEASHFNVKVSAVCPGSVLTSIFDSASWVNIDKKKALSIRNISGYVIAKFAVTPERCAGIILKGVAKNKPIIPVTFTTHLAWRLARISPIGVMKIIRNDFNKCRRAIRTTPDPGAE